MSWRPCRRSRVPWRRSCRSWRRSCPSLFTSCALAVSAKSATPAKRPVTHAAVVVHLERAFMAFLLLSGSSLAPSLVVLPAQKPALSEKEQELCQHPECVSPRFYDGERRSGL